MPALRLGLDPAKAAALASTLIRPAAICYLSVNCPNSFTGYAIGKLTRLREYPMGSNPGAVENRQLLAFAWPPP